MPYVNDIFVFFQIFKKQRHVLDIFLTFESDIGGGHLFNLGGNKAVAQCGKFFCNLFIFDISTGDDKRSEKITFPAFGGIRPTALCIVVVFPAPLAPMRVTISP